MGGNGNGKKNRFSLSTEGSECLSNGDDLSNLDDSFMRSSIDEEEDKKFKKTGNKIDFYHCESPKFGLKKSKMLESSNKEDSEAKSK